MGAGEVEVSVWIFSCDNKELKIIKLYQFG